MTRFRPQDEGELVKLVAWAAGEGEALEVLARSTKRALGRPVEAPHVLDVAAFSGVRSYEPEELVLTAGAATPMAEIARVLESAQQMLAFEPGDWGPLLGADGGRQTLSGVLAANLAGPRRIKYGAARDHLLGFHAVSGRGEAFKAGGRVVKNVTGYDLSKLMAGSFGTLAVLTEVTVKVLPRPEETRTLLLAGLGAEPAVAAMTQALQSPHEVSGAAHIPSDGSGARSTTLLRVEGHKPSVEARSEALRRELGEFASVEFLDGAAALTPWRSLADLDFFAGDQSRVVWRLSVAPQAGPGIAAEIARGLDAKCVFDWGGGLVWLGVASAGDGGAATVRAAIAARGGHATLIRAPAALRMEVPVFEPLPAALQDLTRRIKDGFDPRRILNPGRMYRAL
ncbi:MAG TPA: glycolate oxidase subunit GlcE [Stellaceae bacterium]|nr:glycolate oxidase subunit GlcE [Stellaceae bacterium]